jgi:hypothetical protein
MKLSDKIASLEDALTVPEIRARVRTWGDSGKQARFVTEYAVMVPYIGAAYGTHRGQTALPEHMWWFVREELRFLGNRDLYGSVLCNLWATSFFLFYCPKPDPADNTKILFFPDANAARADRPVSTTVGRFLNKVAPVYDDEYIKNVDAVYRAEMSTELELLTGIEGFRVAYLEGPSSCMSKIWHDADLAPDEYKPIAERFDGHHPVDVYDVLGMAVAVGRDAHGRINARCVTYVNPADPTDKRMIRVYGDSSLQNRLKRNGYEYKPLTGVSLKCIPVPKVLDWWAKLNKVTPSESAGLMAYAAPFFDGIQGRHSDGEAGRTLLRLEGEESFRILSNKHLNGLQKALQAKRKWTGRETMTPGADGHVILRTLKPDDIHYTCPVTGRTVDLTTTIAELRTIWADGAIKQALLTNEEVEEYAYVVRTADEFGDETAFYTKSEIDPPRFVRGHVVWLENDNNRRRLGYRQLHPDMYPEMTERWIDLRNSGYGRPKFVEVNGEEYIYKPVDCVQIAPVDDNGDYDQFTERNYVSKRSFDSRTYIRLHSVQRGVAIFTLPHAKVVKTDTGRTVLPGYHSVVQCVGGAWTFERNATVMQFAGYDVYVQHGKKWDGTLADNDPVFVKMAANLAVQFLEVEWATEFRGSHLTFASFQDHLWNRFLTLHNDIRFYPGEPAGYFRYYGYDRDLRGYEADNLVLDGILTTAQVNNRMSAEGAVVCRQLRQLWIAARAEYEQLYIKWCEQNEEPPRWPRLPVVEQIYVPVGMLDAGVEGLPADQPAPAGFAAIAAAMAAAEVVAQ